MTAILKKYIACLITVSMLNLSLWPGRAPAKGGSKNTTATLSTRLLCEKRDNLSPDQALLGTRLIEKLAEKGIKRAEREALLKKWLGNLSSENRVKLSVLPGLERIVKPAIKNDLTPLSLKAFLTANPLLFTLSQNLIKQSAALKTKPREPALARFFKRAKEILGVKKRFKAKYNVTLPPRLIFVVIFSLAAVFKLFTLSPELEENQELAVEVTDDSGWQHYGAHFPFILKQGDHFGFELGTNFGAIRGNPQLSLIDLSPYAGLELGGSYSWGSGGLKNINSFSTRLDMLYLTQTNQIQTPLISSSSAWESFWTYSYGPFSSGVALGLIDSVAFHSAFMNLGANQVNPLNEDLDFYVEDSIWQVEYPFLRPPQLNLSAVQRLRIGADDEINLSYNSEWYWYRTRLRVHEYLGWQPLFVSGAFGDFEYLNYDFQKFHNGLHDITLTYQHDITPLSSYSIYSGLTLRPFEQVVNTIGFTLESPDTTIDVASRLRLPGINEENKLFNEDQWRLTGNGTFHLGAFDINLGMELLFGNDTAVPVGMNISLFGSLDIAKLFESRRVPVQLSAREEIELRPPAQETHLTLPGIPRQQRRELFLGTAQSLLPGQDLETDEYSGTLTVTSAEVNPAPGESAYRVSGEYKEQPEYNSCTMTIYKKVYYYEDGELKEETVESVSVKGINLDSPYSFFIKAFESEDSLSEVTILLPDENSAGLISIPLQEDLSLFLNEAKEKISTTQQALGFAAALMHESLLTIYQDIEGLTVPESAEMSAVDYNSYWSSLFTALQNNEQTEDITCGGIHEFGVYVLTELGIEAYGLVVYGHVILLAHEAGEMFFLNYSIPASSAQVNIRKLEHFVQYYDLLDGKFTTIHSLFREDTMRLVFTPDSQLAADALRIDYSDPVETLFQLLRNDDFKVRKYNMEQQLTKEMTERYAMRDQLGGRVEELSSLYARGIISAHQASYLLKNCNRLLFQGGSLEEVKQEIAAVTRDLIAQQRVNNPSLAYLLEYISAYFIEQKQEFKGFYDIFTYSEIAAFIEDVIIEEMSKTPVVLKLSETSFLETSPLITTSA